MYTFSSHAPHTLVIGDFVIRPGNVVKRNDIDVANMSQAQISSLHLAISQGLLTSSHVNDPKSLVTGPLPMWPFGDSL